MALFSAILKEGGAVVLAEAVKESTKTFWQTLRLRFRGARPVTRVTRLSDGETQKERIRKEGALGRLVLDAHQSIIRAINDERFRDVVAVGEMVRTLCRGNPVLGYIDAMTAQNLSVGYANLHEFKNARRCNREVLSHPNATARLKYLGKQEAGMIEFEEHCRTAPRMTVVVREHFLKAERLLTEAGEGLPDSALPGNGLLHVANVLEDLGERSWSEQVLDKAKACLDRVEDKSALDYLKGHVAEYFPALSRRRDLLRTKLPWLFILVLSVALSAACISGSCRFTSAVRISSAVPWDMVGESAKDADRYLVDPSGSRIVGGGEAEIERADVDQDTIPVQPARLVLRGELLLCGHAAVDFESRNHASLI